jgi:hypothetical protein
MLIDQILDILVQYGRDPSTACGIELEPFFILALRCSVLYLFAGKGAVDFVG